MSGFNAEEYKKQLEASESCFNCEKVPLPKLKADDRYIFISYSHKDYKMVYSDLADLYESDIPFWYDSGLPAGQNWDDVVREKMTDSRCAGVIFFLSESLFLSRSIRTEVEIAINHDQSESLFTPGLTRKYFCVNLAGKSPSQIIKSVFAKKEFPDTEDEMTARMEWLATLAKAFPDKATYLPFDAPHHKSSLVQQIGVNFGISPNYNPFDFGSAIFRSGSGVIEFESGAVYDGEFADGLFSGIGTLAYSNGSVYNGEWAEGKRHGQGTAISADGTTYTGEWANGNQHGQGTISLADGTTYTGEWANGKQHGQGTISLADGTTYTGDWANGNQHGQGTLTLANGTIYTGEWTDGNQHGQGTLTLADGTTYAGEWVNGMFHGHGTMIYSNGATYTGKWVNGKENGLGTLTFSDGTTYTGQWVNGKRYGKGKLTFTDGANYTGEWADGLPNGYGTFTFSDGTVQTGYFENGDFIGENP